jgi:hypothetical protein
MYGLAVVAMTEILQHWLARELYLHSPARTLNCGVHYDYRGLAVRPDIPGVSRYDLPSSRRTEVGGVTAGAGLMSVPTAPSASGA